MLLLPLLWGCASGRAPIPPGEIPQLSSVPTEDEQYGHQVFSMLSEQFELARDDAQIERIRSMVDTLTAVRGNDQHLWHVYLFKDDTFVNAAATRGNFIFVWTGLLKAVENDQELAVVLAHEIGHVLAGHTRSDPSEQANEILASSTGQLAREIMIRQGGTAGSLAGVGGAIAAELIKGLVVYPNKQRLEIEADQLGLYLMAEAGYNPEAALTFWKRMEEVPEFGGSPISFLSTHPSSTERITHLRSELPQAMARYRGESASPPVKTAKAPTPPKKAERDAVVLAVAASVYAEPNRRSEERGTLIRDDEVTLIEARDEWVKVSGIYDGWVLSSAFTEPGG